MTSKKTEKVNRVLDQIVNGMLVVVVFLCILLMIHLCTTNKEQQSEPTSTGIVWSETAEAEEENNTYITVPAFTSTSFTSGKTTQEVSIYNKDVNQCYMIISIIVDDGIIWESGELYPGYGYEEIELNEPLVAGTYDAAYQVRCFDLETGQELNGCTVNFKLYVY